MKNILYLNKNFYVSKIVFTFLSFLQTFWCSSAPSHLRMQIIQKLWNDLVSFFKKDFTLFDLIPQVAFLDFLQVDSKVVFVQNYLLLIFEMYVFNSRRSESLILTSLISEITKVKNLFNKQWKKSYYVQERMEASWKCFEDQNCLILYLIQPLSRKRVRIDRGSK